MMALIVLALCSLVSTCVAHELVQSYRLPPEAAKALLAEQQASSSLHLRRRAVKSADGKSYVLFLMPNISYVNNTFNVTWSYEVPHELEQLGDDEQGAVVEWHSMDVAPLSPAEHPAPYHKSGLALMDMRPFMKAAGVASTPRVGDSNEAGSWRSPQMRHAVAKAVSSGELKDKFGQPLKFEGCTGPNSAVMITDATYRTTEHLDLNNESRSHDKIFHVGWAHIDRWEYSAAHVLEWEMQWEKFNLTKMPTCKMEGEHAAGGHVNGRSVCGSMMLAWPLTLSQGATKDTALDVDPDSCYDTHMHNVWLSLGTRKGLDDPMGPMKARHFAVQTPHEDFDKCDLTKAAPMMAGTCRSLLAKYGPWVKEGKWWYKPDTEFGEALAFRGQEGSPHATLSSQADEPHRESVDMRIVCVKKRDSCPAGMRRLLPQGRDLPFKPTDRRADTMCLPK